MRHKKEQDRAFYQLLDAFKTVKPAEKDSIKPPSRLDNINRAPDEMPKKQPSAKTLRKQKDEKARQVQEQYLLNIIDRMSKENNIDFILPKERTKGDSLKLIMEIAVVLNWR